MMKLVALLVTVLLAASLSVAGPPIRWLDIGSGIHAACEGTTRLIFVTTTNDFIVVPKSCSADEKPLVGGVKWDRLTVNGPGSDVFVLCVGPVKLYRYAGKSTSFDPDGCGEDPNSLATADGSPVPSTGGR